MYTGILSKSTYVCIGIISEHALFVQAKHYHKGSEYKQQEEKKSKKLQQQKEDEVKNKGTYIPGP